MSIKDFNAARSKAKPSGQLPDPPLQDFVKKPVEWSKPWPGNRKRPITPRPSYRPLLFCLLIAIAVRAWLVIHTHGFVDGDEALVGIQAQHILRGELPIYFYNQPYMGSLEAYIMAGIFAIVGPSIWALRAEPILLSLVVVWLTWKFASLLADTAHLPLHAKQWFMTIAALLAAIPPLYDTVLELHTLGGYVEVFILMLLLLHSVLKMTNRRAAGASRHELTWRWVGIGFIAGCGFWVNPLIIYGILAAALWIVWDWVKVLNGARRINVGAGLSPTLQNHALSTTSALPTTSVPRTPTSRISAPRNLVLPALASIPGCIVGLVPALYWGAMNRLQNFTYLLQLSGNPPLRPQVQAHFPTRLDIFFGLTHLYTTCVGPRVISGALPGEDTILRPLHTPTLVLSGLCVLASVGLVALSLVRPHPSLLRVRRLVTLPIVFAASVSIIFCITQTAASGLWSCQYDFAGRYATPLMLVVPFFVAYIFTTVVMLEADIYKLGQKQASDEELVKVTREEIEAAITRNTRVTPPHLSLQAPPGLRYQRAILGLLVGFLILSVYLQVSFYGLSAAGSTFQSPFCTFAPANNDAIIAYMQREHIHYAWANNWIAYPIVFKTHASIIISDPLPIIRHIPILDRIPAYTESVRHADRSSLLIFVKHKDPYPELLQMLDAEHVTYHLARFPAQEGRDVLVITPLNRTVSPFTSSEYFNIFICSRDS